LLEVQETERRSLASELHDRVGQSLTALGLNLSIVSNLMQEGSDSRLRARLADSRCSSNRRWTPCATSWASSALRDWMTMDWWRH
jgi:nitrate/nitrite-specific signal transduction histidine kinase